MTISEAIREAAKTSRCITTPDRRDTFKLMPTNSPMACVASRPDGTNARYCWSPMERDLTRDDWIVV